MNSSKYFKAQWHTRIWIIGYNLLEANDLSQYDQMEPLYFYLESEIKCLHTNYILGGYSVYKWTEILQIDQVQKNS